ncbi:hypothetical protein GCM10011312_11330 [Planktosalinus lacus]|uniref:Uncharacterized protein n=2 Tax=Planktosalinus lacus TaxID=1526573 RepID=A0A8J2V9T4_9FLAO|nr:hypothetical protein GCM10011312_11330 [Planktosalinus lacus]
MNQLTKILIILFIISLTISCTDKKKEDDQDGNIMNEDQTEIMEGEDHMHEDSQTDGHRMDDNTPMEMNEEQDH